MDLSQTACVNGKLCETPPPLGIWRESPTLSPLVQLTSTKARSYLTCDLVSAQVEGRQDWPRIPPRHVLAVVTASRLETKFSY